MNIETHPRLFAITLSAFFVGLVFLYYKELPIFTNTIGVKRLVLGSIFVVLFMSAYGIWRWRDRFQPWDRHLPDVLFILLMPALFAPLFGSLLNRVLGHTGNQSFEFVSETPFIAEGYGLIKGEEVKIRGYHLRIKDKMGQYRLTYKQKAYPLSKPGDVVLLPVRWGILGGTVVEMQ